MLIPSWAKKKKQKTEKKQKKRQLLYETTLPRGEYVSAHTLYLQFVKHGPLNEAVQINQLAPDQLSALRKTSSGKSVAAIVRDQSLSKTT